ncbi:hypothetical protein LCGC14_1430570, partial [marine sediment metagenome]
PRRDQRTTEDYHTPSELERDQIPGDTPPEQGTGGQSHSGEPGKVDNIYPEPSNWLRPLKGLPYTDENINHDFNTDFDTEYHQRQRGLNMRRVKKSGLNLKKAQQPPKWTDPKFLGSALYLSIKEALKTYSKQIREDPQLADMVITDTIPELITRDKDLYISAGVTLPIMLEAIKEAASLLMVQDKIALDTLPAEQAAVQFYSKEPRQQTSEMSTMEMGEARLLEELTADQIWDIARNPETENTPEGQAARGLIEKGIVAGKLNMKKQSNDFLDEVGRIVTQWQETAEAAGVDEVLNIFADRTEAYNLVMSDLRSRYPEGTAHAIAMKVIDAVPQVLQIQSSKLNMKKEADIVKEDMEEADIMEEDMEENEYYALSLAYMEEVGFPKDFKITNGYDFGATEGELFAPGLTNVDIEDGDIPNTIIANLDTPIQLPPKPFISLKDVTNELAHPDIVADNIDYALLPGGTVFISSVQVSVDPYIDLLTSRGYQVMSDVFDAPWYTGEELEIEIAQSGGIEFVRNRSVILKKPQVLQIQSSNLNMKKEAEVNPKYDHGTVQTSDVSETVTDAIKDVQNSIDKNKLYDGEDEPGWVENGIQKLFHITVLFGVNDNVKDAVKKVFDKYRPIHIETIGIKYFSSDPNYDVAIVRCKSEELTKIHNELKDTLENKDTYPTYKPHITIAYLKKGERLDDSAQISNISWEVDSLDLSTSDGQLEKISALAIPIRESLDYPHSWSRKKKKEVVPKKEKKILQMDFNKLNFKKKAQYKYDEPEYPEGGYDFGGAELPQWEGLTIVDIHPEKTFREWGYEDPYIQQDIGTENFPELEQKPYINMSKAIRSAGVTNNVPDPIKLQNVAINIDRSLSPGGIVSLFDYESVLQPVVDQLKSLGYVVKSYNKSNWHETEGLLGSGENEWDAFTELQKPETQAKRSSILDEPRATLDSAIWDIGRDDLPMLKPSIKIHIVENFLSYVARFGGYIKPEQWVKNMFYTGSTATYAYNDMSDIDIHIVVDWIDLAALNPDKSKADPKEMWQELHDVFWWTLNKIKLPGTKHPLTYYVMPPGDEKKLVDQKEEIYDIGHEVWLIPPGKAMNLTEEVIDPALEEASEFMARINQHIADARRGVIDYALLQEVITSENAADRYIQIAGKVKEIDHHLKELKEEYALLKQKRTDAFEQGDSLVGGNSNWSMGNIIFKIVERYKYMDILRKIKRITDDMDLRPDQIQEIANVLGLDLEEE